MNSLRVERSLELLESLKTTVAEFARKEEQLARHGQARRSASHRKFYAAVEEQRATLERRLQETEQAFALEEDRLGERLTGRRARVEQVRTHDLWHLPKRARQTRENWLGDLQMRLVAAEQERSEALQRASAIFTEDHARLTQEKHRLARLKQSARAQLRSSFTLARLLQKKAPAAEVSLDPDACWPKLDGQLAQAGQHLATVRKFWLPYLFRFLPLPLLAVAGLLAGIVAWHFGSLPGVALTGLFLVTVVALSWFSQRQMAPAARALARSLAEAERTWESGHASSGQKFDEEGRRIETAFENTRTEIAGLWNRAGEVEVEFFHRTREKIETQAPRLILKIEARLEQLTARTRAAREGRMAELAHQSESQKEGFTVAHENETAQLAAEDKTQWDALAAEWRAAIGPLYQAIAELNRESAARFPAWEQRLVEQWSPASEIVSSTRFARLAVEVRALAGALPADPRLALPGPVQLDLPLALTYPGAGSLLFTTKEAAHIAVSETFNNVILRLLATTPPGKIAFTIIDPVGLGQNFAGLMHLSDYEESLINRRIWTQHDQIEERLAELNEHLEKVIQMYLRNEYATITEYNAQAGSVAEKYHFLVVADFPAQFSETAARRLQSIAASGPRCGVFTLIHWDQRHPLPDGFVAEELRQNSLVLRREKGGFVLAQRPAEAGVELIFDEPPPAELAAQLVHKIGRSSIDSNRVEVPFAQIAPKPDELWTSDTTSELKVAIGRTGATKLQYLAIGKGTRQHALFAGKTGSGKSTLFHVIITNLALACSPEQVEFYLIDFKKGVEFKCYAEKRLPHARVVAIESDREFALSVLQRVDQELKRRGDLFRKLGVQDIPGYKKAGGREPMPRTLLLIDEFQEFFVEDDAIAQTASLLFDRIVRQGRAFGIHVLLGSQTLGGAYTLARATLGQMVIRVALQCNEADAYLIMDDNNSAPRLLSRPGEGIYNDAAGALEGNSPFQVVWLGDDERDAWLEKIQTLAEERGGRGELTVFEGNAPAEVRDNEILQSLFSVEPTTPPVGARCWLGAPNSIKGPTEAIFQRQSGNHLLIVGQREEAALTMLSLSLVALAAQYPVGAAKFVFLPSASAGSADATLIERAIGSVAHEVTLVRSPEIAAAMNELATELKARMAGGDSDDAPPIFVFVQGLQKFKKLRPEDDFAFSMSDSEAAANPGAQFTELITEGSSHGLHLLATVDTFNNVNRFISRKALSEFEMRVVFQMSANDSASLIDSPRASDLGLHRALFYNEREGSLETFRPYATPPAAWWPQSPWPTARAAV